LQQVATSCGISQLGPVRPVWCIISNRIDFTRRDQKHQFENTSQSSFFNLVLPRSPHIHPQTSHHNAPCPLSQPEYRAAAHCTLCDAMVFIFLNSPRLLESILRLFHAPASATQIVASFFTPWTMHPFPIPDCNSTEHAGLLLSVSLYCVESHSRALWGPLGGTV
jgi:hypothetical protein